MNASWRRTALLRLLTAALPVAALLASGCLWGIVTDAETGAPIAGAGVICTDSNGDVYSTTTDANGIYAFDIDDGPVPAAGNVDFQVAAMGYETGTEARLVQYDDSPGASLDDLSSFWEVQSFTLQPQGPQAIEVRVVSVDISHALLAPKGGTTDFTVGVSAYDPDDPGATLCHQETGWYTVTSADPPAQALTLECSVPSDSLEVMLYVGVRRQWVPLSHPVGIEEHDNSTAGFSWEASGSATRWRAVTLDSADAAGPDDPDLQFTAELQYRSVEATP